MSGANTAAALAVLLGLTGCVVQGGAYAGRAFSSGEPDHREVSWGGQLAAALELAPARVGFELEGRSEQHAGSLFTAGLQLGLATDADAHHVGLVGHADIGVPIAWNSQEGFYAGATLELPIRLEEPLPMAERNRNLRILGTAAQLAPFVRYRYYDLDVEGPDRDRFHDVGGGIALRIQYTTDLL